MTEPRTLPEIISALRVLRDAQREMADAIDRLADIAAQLSARPEAPSPAPIVPPVVVAPVTVPTAPVMLVEIAFADAVSQKLNYRDARGTFRPVKSSTKAAKQGTALYSAKTADSKVGTLVVPPAEPKAPRKTKKPAEKPAEPKIMPSAAQKTATVVTVEKPVEQRAAEIQYMDGRTVAVSKSALEKVVTKFGACGHTKGFILGGSTAKIIIDALGVNIDVHSQFRLTWNAPSGQRTCQFSVVKGELMTTVAKR